MIPLICIAAIIAMLFFFFGACSQSRPVPTESDPLADAKRALELVKVEQDYLEAQKAIIGELTRYRAAPVRQQSKYTFMTQELTRFCNRDDDCEVCKVITTIKNRAIHQMTIDALLSGYY